MIKIKFQFTLDNMNEFRSRVIDPTEGCDLAVKYQVGIKDVMQGKLIAVVYTLRTY